MSRKLYFTKIPVIIANKDDDKDFFSRADGTIIEKDYDILFNLFLVKNNARPAFLLEVANHPDLDPTELFDVVRDTYNEFQYTIESEIDGEVRRVFFHTRPLTPKGDDHDIWVAENLGFLCHGIPSRSIERVAVYYYLTVEGENFEFYTEICPKEGFNRDHFDDKQKRFNELASLKGWSVLMEIEKLKIDEEVYYLDLLLTNKLESKDRWAVVNVLQSYAVAFSIERGDYTVDDLLANKKFLLFMILRAFSEYDPFEHLYPLSIKTAKSLAEVEANIYKNLDEDPRILFKKLQKEPIVMEMLEDPRSRRIHERTVRDLFEAYAKLVEKLD